MERKKKILSSRIVNNLFDKNCFFCGKSNKFGLQMRFYYNEKSKETYTDFKPEKKFIGIGRVLHGGIQMGILDEVMGWATFVKAKKPCVTTDFNAKFLKPVYVEKKYKASCIIIGTDNKKIHMKAKITDSDNIEYTTATGSFYILSKEKYLSFSEK